MFARLDELSTGYSRQFWLLFWGMLVNSIGLWIIWPFLTIYVQRTLDVPLATVTLITTADAIARMLVTFIAGPVMDRLGRKSGMALSLVVSGATMLAMSRAASLPLWLLLSAAFGGSNAIFRIGATAMVADLVEPERRVDAYALIRTGVNLGVAVGPFIGGLVVVSSYTTAFYLSAASHLTFAVLTVLFVAESLPAQSPDQPRRTASYGPVLRDRPFMTFVGLITLGGMPAPIMFLLLPIYIKTQFAIPESQYAIMIATNAGMVVMLQYAFTRFSRRYRPLLVTGAGALFYAIGAGSVAWGSAFFAFWVSMVIITIGEMLLFPTSTALTANLAPPDMRARYMGVYNLTWSVAAGIGPVIGGLLNDHLAPVAIWYGALVMGAAGALGFLWLDRSPRNRPAWTQPGLDTPERLTTP